jgi:hypothetical protein
MRRVIIVRGQNGVVVWTLRRTGDDETSWICLRDGFRLVTPQTLAGIESFLLTLAQHSASIVGVIQQVIQLDV